MITLSKLAKLAHVSVSTASKAFSMSSEVNEQTREEIFKLAKELGCFKKFYNAKYPKYVIAVICPEFQSQYYSRTLSLLQKYLATQNCDVCVAATDFSSATEKLLLDYYNNYSNVDSIIIINGLTYIEDSYETPIISINPSMDQPQTTTIKINYENSMAEIFEHFKNHNVNTVGYLGEIRTTGKFKRYKRHMLQTYGHCAEEYVAISEQRFETGGYAAMNSLFERGSLPQAIICAYDYFAIGAIRCILDHGLSVPDDIAVVGIDNIPEAKYLNPPLSSISSRQEILCKIAVDTIMKLLNNETVDSEVTINSKLHLRKSSEIE